MSEQNKQYQKSNRFNSSVILYWITLLLMLIASFFPETRVWGFSQWAYLPSYLPFVLFILLAALPFFFKKFESVLTDDKPGYFIIALPFVLIISTAFYFFKAKTFFLGDGYQIIGSFVTGERFAKSYEYGTALILDLANSFFSGQPAETATLSYQTVSILSGLVSLALILFFSRKLFERNLYRLLFLIGSATGGYMLLFFGYVENYALLNLAVIFYVLTGLYIAKTKKQIWLILLPQILIIFFHVIGVCLIPATLHILLADTPLGKKFAAMETISKLLTGLIVAIVGIAVIAFYYQTNLFFRFALVPPIANRFTVEGYTLFSINHLIDMANLLLILSPGLLLFLPLIGKTKSFSNKLPLEFVVIAFCSALVTVFIFDPKLGMFRDWDLFAFAGIPLVIGGFYLMLSIAERQKSGTSAALLAIILALSLLVPRAVVLATPDYGVKQMINFVDLDKIKNRAGRHLLIKYLRDNGHEAEADLQLQRWQNDFPEVQLAIRGTQASRDGNLAEAIMLNKQAISINPIFWISYSNIGTYFNGLGQYDSGAVYFEIADAINPNNTQLLNNLGFTLTQLTRFDQAEDCFAACIELAPGAIEPILNLMQLYKSSGQTEKFNDYLFIVAKMDNAPAAVFKELGDYYLQQGAFDLAKPAYDTSLFLGMDSAVILELRQNFPQLAE